MKKLSELVAGFLSKCGCPFKQDVLIEVDDEDRFLMVDSICPLKVPKRKMPSVTELIARINLGLKLGKLNIDMQDGEITFRTGKKLDQENIDDETLEFVIFGNTVMLDSFLPAISSVLFTNVSPQEASTKLDEEVDNFDENENHRSEDFPFNGQFGGSSFFFSRN